MLLRKSSLFPRSCWTACVQAWVWMAWNEQAASAYRYSPTPDWMEG
ncbi:hypothetical protein LEMLEM_LOCUS2494 [Lemmus lemmus]